MQIICDKCKAEIQPQPEALRDSEIEYTFFRCPECGEVYPVCVTDEALRKRIAGYNRMRLLIQKQRCTEKFLRNAEALKQKNRKRTRELMEQYPSVPFLQPTEAE
jgi:predicted RNA-binding Zn-ribbon protein involved in translation (DUF1610 family)